jgi:hypothetical protein
VISNDTVPHFLDAAFHDCLSLLPPPGVTIPSDLSGVPAFATSLKLVLDMRNDSIRVLSTEVASLKGQNDAQVESLRNEKANETKLLSECCKASETALTLTEGIHDWFGELPPNVREEVRSNQRLSAQVELLASDPAAIDRREAEPAVLRVLERFEAFEIEAVQRSAQRLAIGVREKVRRSNRLPAMYALGVIAFVVWLGGDVPKRRLSEQSETE